MAAGNAMIYLKCECNVESTSADVYIKDLAEVYCSDKTIQAKCRAQKAYHFQKKDYKPGEPRRCVISVLKLLKIIQEACPGCEVQSIGESDVVLEWIDVDKHKSLGMFIKIFIVSLVSFFGTAFTIMAYHNDIGINEVFSEIYRMLMGREPGRINLLEISYSIGLGLGILIFFNHVGGRRLTKDPTPLEVAMRNYERDINQTLVETASREGKEEENN